MLDFDFHIFISHRGSYELYDYLQGGLGYGICRMHLPAWDSYGHSRRTRRADPTAINNSRATTTTRFHGPATGCSGRYAARSSVLDQLRSDDRWDAAWNSSPRLGMVMVTVSPGRTRTADWLSPGTPGDAIKAEDIKLDPFPPPPAVRFIDPLPPSPPEPGAAGGGRYSTTSPGDGVFSLMRPPWA